MRRTAEGDWLAPVWRRDCDFKNVNAMGTLTELANANLEAAEKTSVQLAEKGRNMEKRMCR